jgi:hypothetical protein
MSRTLQYKPGQRLHWIVYHLQNWKVCQSQVYGEPNAVCKDRTVMSRTLQYKPGQGLHWIVYQLQNWKLCQSQFLETEGVCWHPWLKGLRAGRSLLLKLKELSHEMDFNSDDMIWLVLGLNREQGHLKKNFCPWLPLLPWPDCVLFDPRSCFFWPVLIWCRSRWGCLVWPDGTCCCRSGAPHKEYLCTGSMLRDK